ncbi:pilin N-terminal domain-containing protein [Finegoldia magna]|uniref:pilin N-terminal domain-containing protein n=1 Tax=Finegoldia magna TaxID=1260 RepID=UPI003F814675
MKKRFLSLIIALAMMVGVFTPLLSSAAEPGETTKTEEKTEKVTLHKILMTKEDLQAKKVTVGTGDQAVTKVVVQRKLEDGSIKYYDGNNTELTEANDKAFIDGYAKSTEYVFPGTTGQNGTEYVGESLQDGLKGYFGQSAEPIADVFFAVQNADGKYLGKDGKPLVDNLQDPKAKGFADAVLGGKTTENGLTLDTSVLEQKHTDYKIVEIVELSTYKSADGKLLAAKKAVPVEITLPLTNEKGVIKEAHVYPKNTEEKPSIDKNFKKDHGLTVIEDEKNNNNAGADYKNYEAKKAKVTAELGKEVPYEVKTKVNAGSNYQTLNWKDTMTNGLTFLPDSIELKTNPDLQLKEDTDYKVKADDRGFTLSITADGFKKINAKTHPATGNGEDVEFTLTYKAKVNKNAVQDIPEKNDIKLEYSNNKEEEKQPTPVTPQNGELKVTKTWAGKGDTEEAQVVYTLSNGTTSAAVMLNGKEKVGKKFDLGNGITFEVTGAYAGTFKGEALKTGDWTITERVAGYNETIDNATAGTAAITNTKDNENPTPLNPTEPEVVYYGKRFVKADANTGKRLQGAEFVIKNDQNQFLALKEEAMTEAEKTALATAKTNYDNAVNAWNDAVKANPDTADDQIKVTIGEEEITGKTAVMAKIAELQEKYETAFKAAKNAYTWVASKEAANVVKLVSDAQGKFEIVGLEKGTYHLVETKAPGKYAKLNDQEFKVGEGTYASHATGVKYEGTENVVNGTGNEAQRIDNKLISIPQTGGIGTVIFTAIGLAIMASAIIAIKKRQATEAR